MAEHEKNVSDLMSSKDMITELLKEIIEPEEVDVSTIQLHDKLHPLFWTENGELKPDVRKALLKNAKMFIEFSDLEEIPIKDVTLTGSIANYNYSDVSDVDLHIIIDFSKISDDSDFVTEFLKLKRILWNERLPIKIKGHDLETYFQNSSDPHHSTGVYSVQRNKWLKKPVKKVIDINRDAIQAKAATFMRIIDNFESVSDGEMMEKYEKIKDKIKKYRQAGLEGEGEYSIENLVFKILRNTGYIEKLIEIKNNRLTDNLSLSERIS
jgi:predicted nucleotidyltransferase